MEATGKIDPAFREVRRRQEGEGNSNRPEKERSGQEESESFNILVELDAIETWLRKRRSTWPAEQRGHFCEAVIGCLHTMASQYHKDNDEENKPVQP